MVESESMKWNREILRKIKSCWYWMTNGFFTCWVLIPEQILWLDIPLIRLDGMQHTMNNKILVLTNIYNCTGYFIGFTFLENVVLLAFASHLSYFWIHKTQHKGTFWFLLGNWYFLNTVVKNLWKKVVEDHYF